MNTALIILRLFLPEILAALQLFTKNPQAITSEYKILSEIRDSINAIIGPPVA